MRLNKDRLIVTYCPVQCSATLYWLMTSCSVFWIYSTAIRECSKSQNIDSDLVSHQPVISRLLQECSLFTTLKSARYFSAFSCVSVWNWYQTWIGRLYCVCCVRSLIIFCSPSGVLFFCYASWVTPEFLLEGIPATGCGSVTKVESFSQFWYW